MTSLLDQDLYQFNVAQIILRRFANVHVKYKFTCRNAEKINFFRYVGSRDIEDLYRYLESITLSEEEYLYLKGKSYFHEDFLDWLRCFKFEPRRHLTFKYPSNGPTVDSPWDLYIEGSWLHTIFYEIFILSFLNERFARNYIEYNRLSISKIHEEEDLRFKKKLEMLEDVSLPVIEFGTRRRYSSVWQSYVISQLKDIHGFVGTSNVLYAKLYGIKEIGTFSHQLPMVMQALYPIQHSQKQAFRIWMQEYEGKWGIALSDTLGDEKFLKDFSYDLAKAYDGVRHDSGDPYKYATMIIDMYSKLGINPSMKRIVFSDGLDVPKAIDLYRNFQPKILCSFGIGTNFTFDNGLPVPQIVIKAVEANGQPVIKLSANPAKTMCEDEVFKQYAIHAIKNY